MKLFFSSLILILTFFLPISCGRSEATAIKPTSVQIPIDKSNTLTVPSDNSGISSATVQPSKIAAPTLSIAKSELYVKKLLITNGDCRLPCFWGWAPGDTSWEQARHDLEFLNINYADFPNNNSINHEFGRDFSDFKVRGEINEVGGVIKAIVYWSNIPFNSYFDIKQFLSMTGPPTTIYFQPGLENVHPMAKEGIYSLYLVFEQERTMIEYVGEMNLIGSDYQFCPTGKTKAINDVQQNDESGATFGMIGVQAYNDVFDLESLAEFMAGKDNHISQYPTFLFATGNTPLQFYEQIIKDEPKVCYKTPANLWIQ